MVATFSKDSVTCYVTWLSDCREATARVWLAAADAQAASGDPANLWTLLARPWVELGLWSHAWLVDAWEAQSHAAIDRLRQGAQQRACSGRRLGRELLGTDELPDYDFPFLADHYRPRPSYHGFETEAWNAPEPSMEGPPPGSPPPP